MFEVGFTEILLIFGIALLVLGPEKLPKLAADVGRWAGRARSMARQLRTQLEQETTQLNPLAGIDTDLGTGSNSHNPNSIHTPAAAADAASRAAPAQRADEPATPAAVAEGSSVTSASATVAEGSSATSAPATVAEGSSATSAPAPRDAGPPPGHDGR